MANSNIAIKTTQFKRGLREVLEAKLTPTGLGVLLAGEPAFETDTGQLKIGNGVDSYIKLPYVGNGVGSPDSFAQVEEKFIEDTIYNVFWRLIPTETNQVYGIAIDPNTGKLWEVLSDKKKCTLCRYLSEDSHITTNEIDGMLLK